MLRGEAEAGTVEKPDFDIRGTTLWIAGAVENGHMAAYRTRFDAKAFPWFFDRAFMTRYLDAVAAARYNTIFLWASHVFPYILELPDYPNATELTADELQQNQRQFRWFTAECERRNIRVWLHMYNIHLPDSLAPRLGGTRGPWGSHLTRPTPEAGVTTALFYGDILRSSPASGCISARVSRSN